MKENDLLRGLREILKVTNLQKPEFGQRSEIGRPGKLVVDITKRLYGFDRVLFHRLLYYAILEVSGLYFTTEGVERHRGM